MDDLRRLEAKDLASAKIRSKRRRVSLIRRRTICGSLALFAVAWAIVFGQLVTGNDPALGRQGAHKLISSTQRSKPFAQPEPEVEPEPEVTVEPEVEVEPEPAPEPVITAAS